MSIRIASLLAGSVLAFCAGGAWAQSAPAPADRPAGAISGVEVEIPATPKLIRRQTWDFVLQYSATPNPELDQIARWADPVCVEVLGLDGAQNAAIKARIEGVAKTVALHVDKPGCTANIEIVFTDRPQALMDAVYQKRRTLLGYYNQPDGKRLKTVTRPIQAWYLSATRNVWTGWERIDDQNWCFDAIRCSHGTAAGSGNPFNSGMQSLFKNVLVVADRKALAGTDAGLVADYMVMLTLAQPRKLDECNNLPSVIDAMSSATCLHGRPNGLTAGDAAYLTALYKADLSYRKNFEQSDIAGRMADILIKAKAAAQ